jgi:hypothetical protein
MTLDKSPATLFTDFPCLYSVARGEWTRVDTPPSPRRPISGVGLPRPAVCACRVCGCMCALVRSWTAVGREGRDSSVQRCPSGKNEYGQNTRIRKEDIKQGRTRAKQGQKGAGTDDLQRHENTRQRQFNSDPLHLIRGIQPEHVHCLLKGEER